MRRNIITEQPLSCRMPLSPKDRIEWPSDHMKRTCLYDPRHIYLKYFDKLNPYKRYNSSLSMSWCFPNKDPEICACGCGSKLTGRRTRWSTDDCSIHLANVLSIIKGDTQLARLHVELDHIIPVKHGGGACWLSNYQFLCNSCHRDKTNRDFDMGKYSKPEIIKTQQLTIFT